MIIRQDIFILYGRWEIKTKFIFAFLLIGIFSFRFWQTSGCKNFRNFHLNPLEVKISVESQRTFDPTNNLAAKLFHNKIADGFFITSQNYFQAFEPNLLISIVGFVGVFCMILMLTKIFRKTTLFAYLAAFYILVSSLALTVFDQRVSLYNFAVSLYLFSFTAIFYSKITLRFALIFIFLLILTILQFLYSWQLPQLCNEISFN